MTDIDEILKGSDYFRCEKLHVTMRKVRCVDRQFIEQDDCVNCEQGKKIKEEIGDVKICTKCKTAKALEMFPEDKRTKDGRKIACSECMEKIDEKAKKIVSVSVERDREGAETDTYTDHGHGLFWVNEQGMVVEEIGERPEEVPLCKKGCGRPAMLNKNGKVVNGWCRECWTKRIKEGWKKKSRTRSRSTDTVVLDFSGRAKLLEALKAAAEAEFRSVEQQALFLINEGL